MQLKKIVLGIALLSASLSAGAATPLKIALTTWIGYSPFYVAEGMDMYKKVRPQSVVADLRRSRDAAFCTDWQSS